MKSSIIPVLCALFALDAATHAQPAQVSVHDFVRSPSYPHSYRELASSYDATAVPQLIEMLSAPSEEGYGARIAGLLGVVGDDRAVDALIAYVEQPVSGARLSRDQADTYAQAIMSLGLLVNRTGNERALRYLIDGLTPSVWRRRNVQGMAPWLSSYDEYDRLLSTYAAMGLALSGNPRAGDALRALQQSPSAEQAQFRSGLGDNLSGWLEAHQLVADHGVAGMYDHYDEQRRAKAEQFAEDMKRSRAESEQAEALRKAQQPN